MLNTWQCGQTKVDIFSMTPKILMLVFLQKSISFLTSNNATSCGVVTIMAPVKSASDKYVATDKCSSEVPNKKFIFVYII